MTKHEAFEVKQGDTVYIATMRTVGPIKAEKYVPVLFECNVLGVRKDGTIKYVVTMASTADGQKLDGECYSRVTNDCYPRLCYFERTPYGAMAALHNEKLAAVKYAREKLAKAEAELAVVAAEPLLAIGQYEENAADLPHERECVKCENILPVCCDTEEGSYCAACCPCDHRKAGGDFQRMDTW